MIWALAGWKLWWHCGTEPWTHETLLWCRTVEVWGFINQKKYISDIRKKFGLCIGPLETGCRVAQGKSSVSEESPGCILTTLMDTWVWNSLDWQQPSWPAQPERLIVCQQLLGALQAVSPSLPLTFMEVKFLSYYKWDNWGEPATGNLRVSLYLITGTSVLRLKAWNGSMKNIHIKPGLKGRTYF